MIEKQVSLWHMLLEKFTRVWAQGRCLELIIHILRKLYRVRQQGSVYFRKTSAISLSGYSICHNGKKHQAYQKGINICHPNILVASIFHIDINICQYQITWIKWQYHLSLNWLLPTLANAINWHISMTFISAIQITKITKIISMNIWQTPSKMGVLQSITFSHTPDEAMFVALAKACVS